MTETEHTESTTRIHRGKRTDTLAEGDHGKLTQTDNKDNVDAA